MKAVLKAMALVVDDGAEKVAGLLLGEAGNPDQEQHRGDGNHPSPKIDALHIS